MRLVLNRLGLRHPREDVMWVTETRMCCSKKSGVEASVSNGHGCNSKANSRERREGGQA